VVAVFVELITEMVDVVEDITGVWRTLQRW
jgi:hypothetical protein